jgi:hypothetical protein
MEARVRRYWEKDVVGDAGKILQGVGIVFHAKNDVIEILHGHFLLRLHEDQGFLLVLGLGRLLRGNQPVFFCGAPRDDGLAAFVVQELHHDVLQNTSRIKRRRSPIVKARAATL